ncbi:MAG: hypothetical protein ACO3A4_06940 [Silvanigrellaceae bacterium]
MKSSATKIIHAVCITGLALSVLDARADDDCQDLLVELTEPRTGDLGSDGASARRVTVLVPCEKRNSGAASGAPTVLHFIERVGNNICVSERTCGNVWAWQGYFGVAAGWSDLRLLGDFHSLGNSLRFHRDWNGNRMVASFSVGKGQIERDCSGLSRPTCAGVMK